MADSFAVHIGGGTYLDADGKIVFGAPTGAQTYEAPGGFHLDTKKIQDAVKDLSGLLPADDDAKKKWKEWGVPAAVVDFPAESCTVTVTGVSAPTLAAERTIVAPATACATGRIVGLLENAL